MSDGYQVVVLSLVNVCLGSNTLFVGIVLGQIGFGFFVDRVGPKIGMMVTTFLVILGAALCAGAMVPAVRSRVSSGCWLSTVVSSVSVLVANTPALPLTLPSLLTRLSKVEVVSLFPWPLTS